MIKGLIQEEDMHGSGHGLWQTQPQSEFQTTLKVPATKATF